MSLRGWQPRQLVRVGMVLSLLGTLAVVGLSESSANASDERSRRWLAGDHHIHSEYSVGLNDHDNDPTTPPIPIIAGDAIYPVAINASQARFYGLDWMVQTDHGDPHHSKVNRELAYPALMQARQLIPEVLQFYGMEFDTPGADHSTVMIPKSKAEEESLFQIESMFSKRDPWPFDPSRDTEPFMLEALKFMRTLKQPPVVIAHHASRSAPCPGPPPRSPAQPVCGARTRPRSSATGMTPHRRWRLASRGPQGIRRQLLGSMVWPRDQTVHVAHSGGIRRMADSIR